MTVSSRDRANLEAAWHTWLCTLFPHLFTRPFAPHHIAFWKHIWTIQRDQRPQPWVSIWSRGHTKSTSAETAAVALAARRRRRYAIYVSDVQGQADDHVGNIGALLELPQIARWYPKLAQRRIGKYGSSKGWRRNRLHTASGFIVDALGLDSASRGLKIEDQRPDLIILDDIDTDTDTLGVSDTKEQIISHRILPAGDADRTAIIAVQNLVTADGVFARLADGRADWIADRNVSGPIPAVEGLTWQQQDGRFFISGGEPTWAGMPLEACQTELDTYGLTAFLSECQHQTEPPAGGMFDHLDYQHLSLDQLPAFDRVVCWVDPAVTDTDHSDSHAISVAARTRDGRIIQLFSWERRASPVVALTKACIEAATWGSPTVGIETDQGGETWESVFREAQTAAARDRPDLAEQILRLRMRSEKAGAGYGPKAHRASQMLADYETGRILHLEGTHATLERALRRFPATKPLDLVDATFWSWRDLRRGGRTEVHVPRGQLPGVRSRSA